MFLIPDWIVITAFLLASISLMYYGVVRYRRALPVTWAWLAPSCLQMAWTYWFFFDHQISIGAERSALVRLSIVSLGVSILTISIIAGVYNARRQ